MFVNHDVYDMGTVLFDDSFNNNAIAGIVLGIIAALVVGAALALIVMINLRKKKRGEKDFAILWCISINWHTLLSNLATNFNYMHLSVVLSRPSAHRCFTHYPQWILPLCHSQFSKKKLYIKRSTWPSSWHKVSANPLRSYSSRWHEAPCNCVF